MVDVDIASSVEMVEAVDTEKLAVLVAVGIGKLEVAAVVIEVACIEYLTAFVKAVESGCFVVVVVEYFQAVD